MTMFDPWGRRPGVVVTSTPVHGKLFFPITPPDSPSLLYPSPIIRGQQPLRVAGPSGWARIARAIDFSAIAREEDEEDEEEENKRRQRTASSKGPFSPKNLDDFSDDEEPGQYEVEIRDPWKCLVEARKVQNWCIKVAMITILLAVLLFACQRPAPGKALEDSVSKLAPFCSDSLQYDVLADKIIKQMVEHPRFQKFFEEIDLKLAKAEAAINEGWSITQRPHNTPLCEDPILK